MQTPMTIGRDVVIVPDLELAAEIPLYDDADTLPTILFVVEDIDDDEDWLTDGGAGS